MVRKLFFFFLKKKFVVNYSAVKDFHMYDISSLKSVSFKLYWKYLARSWWSSAMIPEKEAWVQFPTRISVVYSKLLPVNGLIFQFLMKHLHICYKFSYRTSDQEICSAILYKFCKFSPIFFHYFQLFWLFQEKSHFMLYLESCKQCI